MTGYHGRVTVGGPAQVRELPLLVITKLAVGPLATNAYLLRCRTTGRQVLVDAGADAPALLALVGPDGLDAVITTHRHADHTGALAEVVRATGAAVLAHTDDADALPVAVDQRLHQGSTVTVGRATFACVHLRGHSPGGLALVHDDPDGHPHAIVGDSLFPGGVGRTTTPEEFQQLVGDVESRLFCLPDETWIYPGHGDDTTIGTERPFLAEWRARGW